MAGGGKGGSTTSKVEIPAWLEDAAKANLARGEHAASIGPVAYYGPDVAAMTPSQMAAMQGTGQAASAFGVAGGDINPISGMPTAGNYGGVQAYSSGSLYDQALAELKARAPGQYNAITGMFVDPQTGAAPTYRFTAPAPAPAAAPAAARSAVQYAPEGRGFDPSRDVPTGNFDGYAIADAIGGAIGGKNFGFGGMGPTGIFG